MALTTPSKSDTSLTDPAFIQRLESLALLARRVLGGKLQANRRTVRKGSGINFADYAEYTLGDDYRAIDWRVYGRLEHLIIKLFEMEEDMTLVVLLDVSHSMVTKLHHARRLAAALGYLALSGFDQVAIYGVGTGLAPIVEPLHGRGRSLTMLRSLQAVECTDEDSDLDAAVRALVARHRRRAMIVPISDFLIPTGFDRALSRLLHARHEVYAIQVQDEGDRVAPPLGDALLECVETGRTRRVTVTERERRLYEQAVADWNAELRTTCDRRGIGLASVTTDVPFDEIISRILRRGGLVS